MVSMYRQKLSHIHLLCQMVLHLLLLNGLDSADGYECTEFDQHFYRLGGGSFSVKGGFDCDDNAKFIIQQPQNIVMVFIMIAQH